MNQLNSFKLILCFAAILFIAKPFMGFSVGEQLRDKEETNLLVKIFAKRKPEFLEEAAAKSIAIQQLLHDKALAFNFTMNSLLLTLFSFFASRLLRAFNRVNHFGYWRLKYTAPIYLLNRNLTI